jgi:hypothetical protein
MNQLLLGQGCKKYILRDYLSSANCVLLATGRTPLGSWLWPAFADNPVGCYVLRLVRGFLKLVEGGGRRIGKRSTSVGRQITCWHTRALMRPETQRKEKIPGRYSTRPLGPSLGSSVSTVSCV